MLKRRKGSVKRVTSELWQRWCADKGPTCRIEGSTAAPGGDNGGRSGFGRALDEFETHQHEATSRTSRPFQESSLRGLLGVSLTEAYSPKDVLPLAETRGPGTRGSGLVVTISAAIAGCSDDSKRMASLGSKVQPPLYDGVITNRLPKQSAPKFSESHQLVFNRGWFGTPAPSHLRCRKNKEVGPDAARVSRGLS